METLKLDYQELWKLVKPELDRSPNENYYALCEKMNRDGYRTTTGGLITPATISHIAIAIGGEGYRKRNKDGSGPSKQMILVKAKAVEANPHDELFKDISEIAVANLSSSLKIKTLKALVGKL